MTFIFLL